MFTKLSYRMHKYMAKYKTYTVQILNQRCESFLGNSVNYFNRMVYF